MMKMQPCPNLSRSHAFFLANFSFFFISVAQKPNFSRVARHLLEKGRRFDLFLPVMKPRMETKAKQPSYVGKQKIAPLHDAAQRHS